MSVQSIAVTKVGEAGSQGYFSTSEPLHLDDAQQQVFIAYLRDIEGVHNAQIARDNLVIIDIDPRHTWDDIDISKLFAMFSWAFGWAETEVEVHDRSRLDGYLRDDFVFAFKVMALDTHDVFAVTREAPMAA